MPFKTRRSRKSVVCDTCGPTNNRTNGGPRSPSGKAIGGLGISLRLLREEDLVAAQLQGHQRVVLPHKLSDGAARLIGDMVEGSLAFGGGGPTLQCKAEGPQAEGSAGQCSGSSPTVRPGQEILLHNLVVLTSFSSWGQSFGSFANSDD